MRRAGLANVEPPMLSSWSEGRAAQPSVAGWYQTGVSGTGRISALVAVAKDMYRAQKPAPPKEAAKGGDWLHGDGDVTALGSCACAHAFQMPQSVTLNLELISCRSSVFNPHCSTHRLPTPSSQPSRVWPFEAIHV